MIIKPNILSYIQTASGGKTTRTRAE